MPGFKQKAKYILSKFDFQMTPGRRHDKYTKEIVTIDDKKHKIVTALERHPRFIEDKFKTIMKQISLADDKIDPAIRCPYKREMYEQDICRHTKEELRRYVKH